MTFDERCVPFVAGLVVTLLGSLLQFFYLRAIAKTGALKGHKNKLALGGDVVQLVGFVGATIPAAFVTLSGPLLQVTLTVSILLAITSLGLLLFVDADTYGHYTAWELLSPLALLTATLSSLGIAYTLVIA